MKISKTKFMAGVQCLKRLYLLIHEPDQVSQAESSDNGRIEQGREVGILARQLFPGGVEVSGSLPLEQAIRATRELTEKPGVPAIFEGVCEHGNVIVKSDVLQRRKENHWRLVEVKSTADLKEQHLEDVAIQNHVLSGCGVKLASVWLAHINREYVLTGTTVDPRQFFSFRNLTERTKNIQPELKIRLRTQFRILGMPNPPDIPPGPYCIDPVVCEFFTNCNQPKPIDHVAYIPRIHASAMEKLVELGVESIHDIPDDFELTEIQRRACTAVQTGEPWFSEDLKSELEGLEYPVYFMDFETVNPAIPRFAGMHPYDHLPFQWSVHVQEAPGAVPGHFEFLAMDGTDPRRAFISSLCSVLGEHGSIVVYNQQFESQRLWELASWLPEYDKPIRSIQRRLWDLLPVIRNHVYHPAFGGSYSLKAVLPSVVPEMTYDGMEVPNGQAAGLAWQTMIDGGCSEAERQAKRKALLDYCGQDTLGLVRLLETLRQARPGASH